MSKLCNHHRASDPFASHAPEFVLKEAPKWLKRPIGATFGFGGKLATFFQPKLAQPGQGPRQSIRLSTIQTNETLVKEAVAFEGVVTEQRYHEFCYSESRCFSPVFFFSLLTALFFLIERPHVPGL